MDWSVFGQIVIAVFVGAWLYSCGSRHASIIPGEQAARNIAGAIAERVTRNGHKVPPGPPRITS